MNHHQKKAMVEAKRAIERLEEMSLKVVMVCGRANVYRLADYLTADSQGTIDCGKYGLKVNGEAIKPLFVLSENIEH